MLKFSFILPANYSGVATLGIHHTQTSGIYEFIQITTVKGKVHPGTGHEGPEGE
jgi:hypothetical protein